MTSCHSNSNIGLKNEGKVNPAISSMDVYKVSEDGGPSGQVKILYRTFYSSSLETMFFVSSFFFRNFQMI